MSIVTHTLAWIGARAGPCLAVGMVLALFVPSIPEAVLRLLLPITSALVLAVAFTRLDTADVVHQWRDRRLRTLLLTLLAAMVPVGLLLTTFIARALNLDPTLALCLALFAAAPPIASGAAICFMLGFDAALALQLTVVSTLLTPIMGPLCLVWIAGIELPVTPMTLFVSLAAIVGGGCLIGRIARRLIGEQWIAQHPKALDGLAALAMICFIVPMFADVTDTLFGRPLLSAFLLGLVFVLNLGVNLLVRAMSRQRLGDAVAGALGLMSGNRNLALYYASVPPDPVLGLFVALYQVPMFLSPLLLTRR